MFGLRCCGADLYMLVPSSVWASRRERTYSVMIFHLSRSGRAPAGPSNSSPQMSWKPGTLAKGRAWAREKRESSRVAAERMVISTVCVSRPVNLNPERMSLSRD